jgi:hypothetical protein
MVSEQRLQRALVDVVRHMCKQCCDKRKPKGADWREFAAVCKCRDCAIWHTRPGNAPNLNGSAAPC